MGNAYATQFFYGLDAPPYDPRKLALAGDLRRPEGWEEEDFWEILEPNFKYRADFGKEYETFFFDLEQRWVAQNDPICIGLYWDPEGRRRVYLAVRVTRHRTKCANYTTYVDFNLPKIIDRAVWDRLLRAKCEAYGFQWVQPRFHLFRVYRVQPEFESSQEVRSP